jgi:hypothetical protein
MAGPVPAIHAFLALRVRRVGKTNGSRECAPDVRTHHPVRKTFDTKDGGHGAKSAFAHPTNY